VVRAPATDVVASNLAVQTYKGQPVLTWWQGVVSTTGATQSGEDVIVDQHYQTVATLQGQDGWVLTLHEMIISGEDAWVTANKNVPMSLSRYGGSTDGVLDDSAVQEYDIATGKLLYTWDALGHIPLLTLRHPCPQRVPLGRLPRQFDQPQRRRDLLGVHAQHLGRLHGRRQDRRHRMGARW